MRKRWGIVGYGWVARDYMVPAIEAIGDQIAAIADPVRPVATAGIASEAAYYPTVSALLAEGGCDLIYVATPNDVHADAVRQITALGIPVLCEKPMAASLDDAEAMAAAVAQSGALYGTAFDQRYHPAHQAIAREIANRRIGAPVAIRIVYCCWLGPNWSPTGAFATAQSNWRGSRKTAGGGAVADLAPHGLDLVQRLVGESIETLHITLQRRTHAYGVDDGGLLQARTASGILVSLHVAYNCRDKLPRRRLEVLGDIGLLVGIDTMGQTAGGRVSHICGETGIESAIAFDAETSPFVAQVRAFTHAAAGQPHDFSMARDIALARLIHHATEEAYACL